MMFYSKKSKNKIIHNCNCSYLKRMNQSYIGKFESIKEARYAGYHLCKHCAPMWKYYSKEYFKIKEYAENQKMFFEYVDGEIIVQTPYSNWKIIVNGQKNFIFLYHRNTYGRLTNKKELVSGYHSQSVRRNTLIEYLMYIAEHDMYKLSSSYYEKKKSESKKGKKINKQKKRKQKRREHYQRTMNVLALLENEKRYRQIQARE